MKKFLVPIDFSDASINAAKYAVALTSEVPEAELTFYNVYSSITLPTLSSKEEGSREQISLNELNEIRTQIGEGRNISLAVEEGSFVDMLYEYVLGHGIEMVIMGITGSSRIKQVFMGTSTLNIIRKIDCPVMIIPAEAEFKGLQKVVFTSDFTDVARTTPFVTLKEIINTFKPSLEILNVDSEHFVELTPEYKIEKEAMEEKLGEYHPEFSFLRAYDFLEGISSFVESREMDAIITVPRKHSFLSQLFKTSHTKKLAYHSRVPIITLPA